MTKKIPLGIALAFVLIAVALSAVVTVSVVMRNVNSVISDFPEREQLYNGLSEIDELVRAEYYGEVEVDELDKAVAKAYIESLPDEYSKYMTAEEYAEYLSGESGKCNGTGIIGEFDEELQAIKITSVEPGSPAQQAGIAVGDIVLSVDSQQVDSDNASKLIQLLSENGKSALETVFSHSDENGEATEQTVSLKREYDAVTVKYDINGECGYIRISDFFDSTLAQFSAALEAMKNSEITRLIIDLRSNSSGNIQAAALVTDLIVPLATEGSMSIATVNRANGETVDIFTADSQAFTCKAAVLVNSGTAGAAELLACDLRDYGFAVLIGENTAGRGVMQKVFVLENGDAVLLSVGKITPYISESYDKIGLSPDMTVISSVQNADYNSLAHSDDNQYAAAQAYLTSD